MKENHSEIQNYYVCRHGELSGIWTDTESAEVFEKLPSSKVSVFKTLDEAESFSGLVDVQPPMSSEQRRQLGELVRKKHKKKRSNPKRRQNKAKSKSKPERSDEKCFDRFSPVSISRALPTELYIYCAGMVHSGRLGSAVLIFSRSGLEIACVTQSRKGTYPPRANFESIGLALRIASGFVTTKLYIQLLSESDYEVDSVTKYAYSQRTRNWKKADGGEVKNADLIKPIHNLYDGMVDRIELCTASDSGFSTIRGALEMLCMYATEHRVDEHLVLDVGIEAQFEFVRNRIGFDPSTLTLGEASH